VTKGSHKRRAYTAEKKRDQHKFSVRPEKKKNNRGGKNVGVGRCGKSHERSTGQTGKKGGRKGEAQQEVGKEGTRREARRRKIQGWSCREKDIKE